MYVIIIILIVVLLIAAIFINAIQQHRQKQHSDGNGLINAKRASEAPIPAIFERCGCEAMSVSR